MPIPVQLMMGRPTPGLATGGVVLPFPAHCSRWWTNAWAWGRTRNDNRFPGFQNQPTGETPQYFLLPGTRHRPKAIRIVPFVTIYGFKRLLAKSLAHFCCTW